MGHWDTKLPRAIELVARTLCHRVNAHRAAELSIGELLMMALLGLRDDIDAHRLTPEDIRCYVPMRMPRGNLAARKLTSNERLNLDRLQAVVQEAFDVGVDPGKAEAVLVRIKAVLKEGEPH